MADGRRDHGRHVVRTIYPAHLERESKHARRIRRDANPPVFHASDQPIYRRARDDRTYFRVVRRGADPGRARPHGSQLRCVAREPWNRVEGAVSMDSSSHIFWMAHTFDWLCDVLCERPQHYADRGDASLYGLANRSGRSTFERGSRVPPLYGPGPVPFVARRGLSEVFCCRAPAGSAYSCDERASVRPPRVPIRYIPPASGVERIIAKASPPITAIANGC